MNKQPKYEQIKELGIEENLLWDILAGLENMKTIIYYISLEFEDYSDVETVEKRPADVLLDEIRRVMQLTYIFDNEFKDTYKSAETLLEQMND